MKMHNNSILILTTRFLLPFVVLFSFYIQINGETSPGGGFQAGAIFASIFIALDLSNAAPEYIGQILKEKRLLSLSATGVGIYLACGIIPMLRGYNFLNYNALHKIDMTGQKIGIITIEMGVGITVASTLLLIYNLIKTNVE